MSPITARTSTAGVVLGGVLLGSLGLVACNGGATKSCITYIRYAPSGPTVFTQCGPYWHEGGPRQT